MVYFPVALAAAIIMRKDIRKQFLSSSGLMTIAIAAAIVSPNIIWNMSNDFSTLSHTAANANWGANLFHADSGVSFLLSQFIVAGLIPIGAVIWAFWKNPKITFDASDNNAWRMLWVFALTPLAIVTVQAFLSRAHANWAAAAYPAIVILACDYLIRRDNEIVLKYNTAILAVVAVTVSIFLARPVLSDAIGLSAATSNIRGWEEQAKRITAQGTGYDAIAVDDRALMGAMLFYDQESVAEIVALDPNGVDHHYEAFKALDPLQQKRVFFVTMLETDAHVNYRFQNIEPLGADEMTIGDKTRSFWLYEISGYYGNSLTR